MPKGLKYESKNLTEHCKLWSYKKEQVQTQNWKV